VLTRYSHLIESSVEQRTVLIKRQLSSCRRPSPVLT
jgi:hypothetical protein